MPTVKVNVKWSKQTFKDMDANTDEPMELFQTQLWTLTGVPPERQTLLVKGRKLQNDDGWEQVDLKPKTMIMMMGSREEVPDVSDVKASDKPVFAEDLTEPEAQMRDPVTRSGLVNFGNTCYFNATLQCLGNAREFHKGLSKIEAAKSVHSENWKLFASPLSNILISMQPESSGPATLYPDTFLSALRRVAPQFSERTSEGEYRQQDAQECWSLILSNVHEALIKEDSDVNLVDDLFGLSYEVTSQPEDEGVGDKEVTFTTDRMLQCHIGKQTSHLMEGICEGLQTEKEQRSEALGHNVVWKQESRISKLPPYLVVQFVRFRWKPSEQVKAKVLRSVSIPMTLDLLSVCSDTLKESLRPVRERMQKEHDERTEAAATGKAESAPSQGGTVGPSSSSGAAEASTKPSPPLAASTSAALYELVGVLTHRGRTADSGHYVGWTKDKDGTWYRYDDDKVTPQTEEDIKKLSGGGDWHIAYLLMYRAKNAFD